VRALFRGKSAFSARPKTVSNRGRKSFPLKVFQSVDSPVRNASTGTNGHPKMQDILQAAPKNQVDVSGYHVVAHLCMYTVIDDVSKP
jgi:hypothetical protein